MTIETKPAIPDQKIGVQKIFSPQVLSEEELYRQGSYARVKQYVRGWHPEEGILHWGFTGKETIIERDVISPVMTFNVSSNENDHS